MNYRRKTGQISINYLQNVIKHGSGTTVNPHALIFKKTHRFPTGGIDIRLEVNHGIIEEAHIFGDFFGVGDMADVAQRLVGTNYNRAAIAEALADIDIPTYFGGITTEEFLQLIY